MDFQRARSDAQRDQRRRAILETTAAMLTEMPVAQLSLNELSRRVGLAKSNVLRYFESREAVLLELLTSELDAWIDHLETSFAPGRGKARRRGDNLAATLATSMAERPVLCDLISAQASVLERNISVEVALRHKHATSRAGDRLAGLVARHLPELGPKESFQVVVIALFMASAAWPHSQPAQALLDAYASDPTLGALRPEFTTLVRTTLEVSIAGLIARHARTA